MIVRLILRIWLQEGLFLDILAEDLDLGMEEAELLVFQLLLCILLQWQLLMILYQQELS